MEAEEKQFACGALTTVHQQQVIEMETELLTSMQMAHPFFIQHFPAARQYAYVMLIKPILGTMASRIQEIFEQQQTKESTSILTRQSLH